MVTRKTKKGPQGPSPKSSESGMGLDAQARGGAGGDHAEEQQEGRGEAVEVTDGHDTHLLSFSFGS